MSENSDNVLEANNIFSTEIHNAVNDNRSDNANTSNENRKNVPENKKNKNDQNKIVTATVDDSMIKYVYGCKLSDGEEKVVVKHTADQQQRIWRLTFTLH